MNLKKVWDNKNHIIEGITNSIFINQEVEKVATKRDEICKSNICGSYDIIGDGCEVPLSQPCCSKLTGGCGCILFVKQRALASECPKGYWKAECTEEEADIIKGIIEDDKVR